MQTDKTNPEKLLYDWTTYNLDRDVAELELEILPQYVKEGLLVADIGCGDGRHMVYFNLKGNQTVGIEYDSEYAINDARKHAKDHGMRLSIIRADARAIPLKSEAFDYVLCMGSALSEKYWLWLRKKDRRKWAEEMTRICKPRGLMVIEVGYRYGSMRDCVVWIKHYLVAIKSILTAGKVEIGDYYSKEHGCWFHSFTTNEIRTLFSDLPIQIIHIHKPRKRLFPWFITFIRKSTSTPIRSATAPIRTEPPLKKLL